MRKMKKKRKWEGQLGRQSKRSVEGAKERNNDIRCEIEINRERNVKKVQEEMRKKKERSMKDMKERVKRNERKKNVKKVKERMRKRKKYGGN